MKDIYRFDVNQDVFEKIESGKKDTHLLVAENKYTVGNLISFVMTDGNEKKVLNAEIENLLYFNSVIAAVESLGKERCGFKSSQTFETASDKFLLDTNYEKVEKFGIVAIVFKLV